MADKNQPEAILSLHHYGFGVRADPTIPPNKDGHHAQQPERNRADLVVVRGGRGCYIEVKCGALSFPFANLRDEQRAWIETYALAEPFSTPVWIWLRLGMDPPHWSPDKYNPKITWLMPYRAILDAEARLAPYLASIPYWRELTNRIAVKEQRLDAITLFGRWQLRWGKGLWEIPETHPFYRQFIAPVPMALYPFKEEIETWTQPPMTELLPT